MSDERVVTSLRQDPFPTHHLDGHEIFLPCTENALALHEHPI